MKKTFLIVVWLITATGLLAQKGKVYIDLIDALKNSSEVYELDLSEKNINNVANISQLVNLEKLNLSGNNFMRLPEEVTELKKLKHLDISDNKGLSSFPG